jgi:hypothetical protein
MTQEQKTVEKWLKEYERAKAAVSKRAEPLAAWRSELTTLEGEIVTLDSQRLDLLGEGDERGAEKSVKPLEMKRRRAEDLRLLIARRQVELKDMLERIWSTELRALAEAKHTADRAEAGRLTAEASRLTLIANEAIGRAKVAQAQAAISANFESDSLNLKNKAAWLEGELAKLTGGQTAETYTPAWAT